MDYQSACGIAYLAELAPVSIMCFDCDGLITFVNKWHLQHFARGKKTKDDYVAHTIVSLPGIVSSGLSDRIDELFEGNSFYAENIYTSEFSGGHSGYQNIRAMPVMLHEKVVGGIIIREDTTDNVLKNIKCLEYAKIVEALLNATEDSVILVDLEGQLLVLNEEAARRRSKRIEDLVGKNLYDYLDASIVEKRKATVLEVAKSKKAQYYEEIVGGKTYYVSVYPVFNHAGEVIQIASYSRDRTVQKTYELELIQAKEAAEAADIVKTQFLSNISHELRTPLNGILGLSQVALTGLTEGDDYENYKMIYECGKRLLNTINNIIELSDINRRAIEPVLKSFHLKEMMISIKKSYYIHATLANLEIVLHVDDDVPQFLVGDEYRLRQILSNLLENSIKCTSRGKVELSVHACGESAGSFVGKNIINLMFVVQDSGIGIDEAELDKIFRSFHITENYLTKKRSGLGVGLTIVKSLVEILGGSIDVVSKLNEGTRVTLVLPLAVQHDVDMKKVYESCCFSPEMKKKSILIVEDEEINLIALQSFLGKVGFHVLTATNGVEALQALCKERVDLIIMDIQMPEMDGLEATHHIRNGEIPNLDRNVPIVALTAYATEKDRSRFIEFGMNDFIPKPFDVEHLLDTICAHLKLK